MFMGRLSNSQMHLRNGTVCGAQMMMEDPRKITAAEMQIENTGNETTDSGAGFGGLVSTT